MNEIETLHQWMQESERVVFFGGAGVSTESGIPDFRSTGRAVSIRNMNYPPEQILSHTFLRCVRRRNFSASTGTRCLLPAAKPNKAHLGSWRSWEEEGRLKAVITQNIDGLHQAAGSKKVLELHGSVHRNYCHALSVSFTVHGAYPAHARACPGAAAAASSSRMWCSMRKGWIRGRCEAAVARPGGGGYADDRRHLPDGISGGGPDRLLYREPAGSDQ